MPPATGKILFERQAAEDDIGKNARDRLDGGIDEIGVAESVSRMGPRPSSRRAYRRSSVRRSPASPRMPRGFEARGSRRCAGQNFERQVDLGGSEFRLRGMDLSSMKTGANGARYLLIRLCGDLLHGPALRRSGLVFAAPAR